MISEATRGHGAQINHSSGSKQQANQSVDTKMSLAERQFAHQLRVRMDSDYPWYDFLWSSFNSGQVIDIEDLLKDHYVELLKTDSINNLLLGNLECVGPLYILGTGASDLVLIAVSVHL